MHLAAQFDGSRAISWRHKAMKNWANVVRLVLIFSTLSISPYLWSQEVTGTITGTVTDPQGAAVAGATVTATDTDRGTTRTATTNSGGVFTLTRMPVGNYSVKASASGFKTAEHPPFTLVLNQTANIAFNMQVGDTTTNVEVTATTPLLQTQSTDLGSVI